VIHLDVNRLEQYFLSLKSAEEEWRIRQSYCVEDDVSNENRS